MSVFLILTINLLDSGRIAQSQISKELQTIPNLPKDVVATKYAELQVLSVFERSGYNFCRWTFDGQITQTIEIISPGLVCEDRDNIPNFSLKCFVSEGIINTTLGIRFQLQSDFDIQTECAFSVIDPYVPQASGHFNVADCSSTSLLLVIRPSSGNFNKIGEISCENDGVLFRTNGTESFMDQTRCNAVAKWDGLDDVECWNAPVNVTFEGNLKITEGTFSNLFCSYNDLYPVGNSSIYYIGDVGTKILKDLVFGKFFTRDDNNKQVSCQAATPFTKVFNETGRSDNFTITVFYAPYQEPTTSCIWLIDATMMNQSCIVKFSSNPLSSFKSFRKTDEDYEGTFSYTFATYNSFEHVFVLSTEKASLKDAGYYTLIVSSSVFHESSIPFRIFVESNEVGSPATSSPNTDCLPYVALIIPMIILVIIIIILAVIIIVMYKRKNNAADGKQDFNLTHQSMNIKKKKQNTKASFKMTERQNNIEKATYEEIGPGYTNVDLNTQENNQHGQKNQSLKRFNSSYVNSNASHSTKAFSTPYINMDEAKNADIAQTSQSQGGYEKLEPAYEPMNRQM